LRIILYPKRCKKEFPMLLISGIILVAQYALTIFIIGLVLTLIVYFIKRYFLIMIKRKFALSILLVILAACAFLAFSPIYNAEAPTVLGQAQDNNESNFGYGCILNSDEFSLTGDGILLSQDSTSQYYPFRDLSVTNPIIDAQASLLLSWDKQNGSTRILFQKMRTKPLLPQVLQS